MEEYNIKEVQCVRYKLKHLKPLELAALSSEYTFENDEILFVLHDNIATIVLKKCTKSIEEAKAASLFYIKGLENLWHIDYGEKLLEFEYIHADLVVIYPSTGEIRRKRRLESSITIKVVDSNSQPVKILLKSEIDSFLLDSPTALRLANRLKQYLEKKESITSMGYYCYTVIKDYIDNLSEKGKMVIDSKVLKTLSRLTSVLGDQNTARKVLITRTHTLAEIDWIEKTIRLSIIKIGQNEAKKKSNIQSIKMSDLPNLES